MACMPRAELRLLSLRLLVLPLGWLKSSYSAWEIRLSPVVLGWKIPWFIGFQDVSTIQWCKKIHPQWWGKITLGKNISSTWGYSGDVNGFLGKVTWKILGNTTGNKLSLGESSGNHPRICPVLGSMVLRGSENVWFQVELWTPTRNEITSLQDLQDFLRTSQDF